MTSSFPVTAAEVDAQVVCTRCRRALVLGGRYVTVPAGGPGSPGEIWCHPCSQRRGGASS